MNSLTTLLLKVILTFVFSQFFYSRSTSGRDEWSRQPNEVMESLIPAPEASVFEEEVELSPLLQKP